MRGGSTTYDRDNRLIQFAMWTLFSTKICYFLSFLIFQYYLSVSFHDLHVSIYIILYKFMHLQDIKCYYISITWYTDDD